MMDIVSVQGLPFLACLGMLAILGYIGIHVLKREIIFIDIALAQIAAVGAIAAHVIFHFHGNSVQSHALALGSTIVAAAFFAIVRRRVVQIPLEAVIGVSYAVSAAAALFLVGIAPGGHVHIQEMLAGSILWATWGDVLWSTGVFAAVGLCFYLFRKPFRSISESYDDAIARGYNTLAWDFLFYALVGVVITMAVRVAGVVVVFAFLIIPATLSASFATDWTRRLVVTWGAGAVSTALGLLFAERHDFSVGPSIGMFLGASLIAVGLLRVVRVTRIATAATVLVIAVALGGWFAAGSTAHRGGIGGAPDAGATTHSHSYDEGPAGDHMGDADAERSEIDTGRLATLTDTAQLEKMYAQAADSEERSAVVCRMLEVEPGSGVRMAIAFLQGDPPLLFRLTIVDKLGEITERAVAYDIDQPFTAPINQEAMADLRERVAVE